MNLIELKNVTKKYGRQTVVDNVSLSVGEGEIAIVYGRNGSGKTVLQRIILDLVKEYDGVKNTRCEVYGEVDGPALFRHMNARENIRSILGESEIVNAERYAGIFGVNEFGDKRVAHYSTGMRQRLFLAIVLAKNAGLTVLDEPFSGLDAEGVSILNKVLTEERAGGRSFLVATHILTGLEDEADRLYLMENGRLRDAAREELPVFTENGD